MIINSALGSDQHDESATVGVLLLPFHQTRHDLLELITRI